MKFKIDFEYEQLFLPSTRHRKKRSHMVTATGEILIPEIGRNDFPVALITHQREQWIESDTTDDEAMKFIDRPYRYFANNFWKQVRLSDWICWAPGYARIADLKEFLTPTKTISKYDLPDEYEPNKSIVVSDDRKKRLNAIKEKASSYLLFEGQVWQKAAEPVYTYITFGVGYNDGTMFKISSYTPGYNTALYFNALQREEAISWVKGIATARHDTISAKTIGEDCNIEVMMPETIKWMRALPLLQLGNLTSNGHVLRNTKVAFLDEGAEEPTPYLNYEEATMPALKEVSEDLPDISIKFSVFSTSFEFGLSVSGFTSDGEALQQSIKKIEAFHFFVDTINSAIKHHREQFAVEDIGIDTEPEQLLIQEEA